MLDRTTIESAKQVDATIILDEFNWQMNAYGKVQCPHPDHNDSSPSCSYSPMRNTFKCFGCGEVFDTINLYQCLCEKVDGRTVPFFKAVEEILELDNNGTGVATNNPSGNNVCSTPKSSNNVHTSPQSGGGNICSTPQSSNNVCSAPKSSPYDLVISNSKPLTGYELNYLHSRAIFLYDCYVYNRQVYTVQNINKALLTATDQNEINRLNEIKSYGTLYRGIAPILKDNRIQIKHNYWQGTNSIIYHIDYEAWKDNDLCIDQFYEDTERHMAIQKTLDNNHTKRALGTSNFNFITRGINNGNIYICEGLEDAFSFIQNGYRSISLNSIANLKTFMQYLEDDCYSHRHWKYVIAFDHDACGQKATQELIAFFEDYNKQNPTNKYKYGVCNYPQQYHDINDYWVSQVFK